MFGRIIDSQDEERETLGEVHFLLIAIPSILDDPAAYQNELRKSVITAFGTARVLRLFCFSVLRESEAPLS
jgi:hypothetical protein